jgi:hypothetical protein
VKHPAAAAAKRTPGTASRKLIISSPSARSRPGGGWLRNDPVSHPDVRSTRRLTAFRTQSTADLRQRLAPFAPSLLRARRRDFVQRTFLHRIFAFLAGISSGSFARICSIASIMPRGLITGEPAWRSHASIAPICSDCRRTPKSFPVLADRFLTGPGSNLQQRMSLCRRVISQRRLISQL